MKAPNSKTIMMPKPANRGSMIYSHGKGIWVAGVIATLALACAAPAIAQTTFFADDFESYTTDANVTGAGWTIFDTSAAIELSSWTITNPGARTNPPTSDGTASTGMFMISDSDAQAFSNTPDTGASHDLITPSFSTVGSAVVWLHVDATAQLNDNGAAIWNVDVSTDGGSTYTNAYRTIAPGRLGNFATTFLPDNTNTDGFFGRLDVQLSPAAANQADVRVRFSHYEPNFDWWIAIDNVVIDDVAGPQGGPDEIFSEDFSSGTLGAMTATGLNTGTETWHTTDKGGWYTLGVVANQAINRLNHATGQAAPNFAMMDSLTDPDAAEDEYLRTPVLDLMPYTEVFLHFKSETIPVATITAQQVLVSIDGGATFLPPLFDYLGGGGFRGGEDPLYADRIFRVNAAAGVATVVFAFRFASPGNTGFWGIDDIRVTAGPAIPVLGTDDWEVFE